MLLKNILFTGALLLTNTAFALTADEIVNKANQASYYKDVSGKAKVDMTITDSQGRTRERSFVILRKDMDESEEAAGDQKFYVYFTKPADVNKTTFLVWKHIKTDDDRWLYLPALDLVKRIAASDKRTSFVGSNFFYEDVSGRNPADDTHTLKEETDDTYIIENTPKSKEGVEFDRYITTVHKGTFLPIKTEYYKDDKVYRIAEAMKVALVENIPTVVEAKMTDVATGGFTTMKYTLVDYGFPLEDNIFTERYLRTPPRRALR